MYQRRHWKMFRIPVSTNKKTDYDDLIKNITLFTKWKKTKRY